MKETMKKFGAWLIAAALAFAGTGAARAETVKVADQTVLEAELVKVNVGESAEFELAAGEFTTYGMSIAQGKTLTFIGALGANGELLTTWKYGKNGTVSSGEGASDYSFEGANVTFRNLVVADNLSVNNYYRGLVRSNGLVFENCTIRNMMGYLGSGDVVFKDCTFDVADVCEYCIKTYSGSSFVFDGCTFKSNNKGFVQVYCEKVDAVRKVMVKNCTFIAGANTSKSAIYFYDYSYGQGATWDIDFVGKNVVTEGHKLWGDMKIGTGAKTRIAINGVAVWENGANVVTVEDVKPVVASAAEFDVVPADGETEIGSGDVEVVEAVMANAAVEGVETGIEEATAGVAADKKYVSVVLTSASVSKADSLAKVVSMTFEVTPCAVKISEGSKSVEAIPNSAITAPITFRFPVDAAVAVGTKADVTHNGVAMTGDFAVAGDDTAKYIEVASTTFSTFAYALKEGGEEPTYAAYIGTTGYETIQAAVDAADISSGAVTIIVKPGTYTEGISLNKGNLQFTEGSVTYYGKISLVGEAGATLKGYVTCNNQNLSDFSISGFTLICDGTTPKTNGTLTPLYLEVASEGGSIRNVRIANNNITGTELGAYVLAASCTGIEFSGNTVSSSGYHLKVGSSEGKIDDVTISGNTFGRLIGIYGSVGENGVSVSGNTFSCSGYAMWINNSSGSDYAKPISFSDNAFATSVSYVIGFTGKVGKSVLKIDEGNTFDGIGITGWADVANHEVFINGNAEEGLALYYDTKLYLGDETAFATLDAAVAASKDDEPITIVNYDSSMKAPEGWEFKTEGGVTKLVKTASAVCQIVETGVKYPTLQAAIDAVPTDGTLTTIKMISDVVISEVLPQAVYNGIKSSILIPANKSVVLDLNGHTVEGRDDQVEGNFSFIAVMGKLVVDDTSDDHDGCIADTPSYYAEDHTFGGNTIQVIGGDFTLRNGTIQSLGNDGVPSAILIGAWLRGGSCTINGGAVVAVAYAIRLNPIFDSCGLETSLANPVRLTIKGGWICAYDSIFIHHVSSGISDAMINIKDCVLEYQDCGIYSLSNQGDYTLNVGEGAVFRCDATSWDESYPPAAILAYTKRIDGNLNPDRPKTIFNISGGVFDAPAAGDSLYVVDYNCDGDDVSNVSISGGTFPSAVELYGQEASVTGGAFGYGINITESDLETAKKCISGGIFAYDYWTDNLVDGYAFVENTDPDTSTDYPWTIGEAAAVCQIGTTTYPSLAAAVAEVPKDGTLTTIKMIADEAFAGAEGKVAIASTKNVVLDLNGFTLSYTTEGYGAFISNNGTLEITDTSVEKLGKITAQFANPNWMEGCYTVDNGNDTSGKAVAKLTITAGTIENTSSAGLAWPINNGSWNSNAETTINGGTIHSVNYVPVRQYLHYAGSKKLVINGGTFISDNSRAVAVQFNDASVQESEASVIINGGDFSCNGSGIFYMDLHRANVDTTGLHYEVNGGKFKNANKTVPVVVYDNEGNVQDSAVLVTKFIKGGIFSAKPADDTIATGYAAENNPDAETAATYQWKVQEPTVTTEEAAPIVVDISKAGGEPSAEAVEVPVTVTQELANEILNEIMGQSVNVTQPLTETQVQAIVTQLETKGEDGMTGWQKYTAGFSQTDKHPLAPKGQGGENGQLVLVTSLITPKQMSVDTGVKVKYILLKGSGVDEKTGLPTNWTKVQELPTPEFPVDVTQLDPETYWKIDVEYTATKTVEVPVGPAN